MKKIGKALLKVLITIIVVLLIAAVIGFVQNRKAKKESDAWNQAITQMGIPFPTDEELDEEMKNTPSDLKGMSQYDKTQLGLDWRDGSDSDSDGLTDQEELEVYHTDPLKMSTADDLYTDGYKVNHNMDPLKYYEYEGEIRFDLNECQEIILSAERPSDFNTVVQDDTDKYSLEQYGISPMYKAYTIYNYYGTLSIDLTNVFNEYDISFSNINIYVMKGQYLIAGQTKLDKVSYEKNENTATLKYEFETTEDYKIFITGKKLSADSIGLMFKEKDNPDASITIGLEEGNGLIWSFSAAQNFLHVGSVAEYEDMDDDAKSAIVRDKLIEVGNNEIAGEGAFSVDGANVKKQNGFWIELKYKFLKTFFPNFEYTTPDSLNYRHAVFGYYHCTESFTYEQDKTASSFDKYVDELPFRNFASYIGKAGNCAGISHLTSYLYNNGQAPTSGSYVVDGKKIAWDLTKDDINKTLYDPGLSDYMDKGFIDSRATQETNYYIDAENSGEKEFINMIGCYWAEANDKSDLRTYMMTNGKENEFSLIEDMIEQLDQGKVLDLHLLMRYGGGHAVNVYGYMRSKTDPDQYWFKVYDSNIPQDDRSDLNTATPYLSVHRHIDEDGHDGFIYVYYPIEGNTDYIATSDRGLMPKNSVIVMDDKWNVFNEK